MAGSNKEPASTANLMDSDRLLDHIRNQIRHLPRPLFLGLSGGVDSLFLLDALSRLRESVTVIHVHHGLQANADDWADHCRQAVEQRGFVFHLEYAQISEQGNIEAQARTARYAAFRRIITHGTLLLAHHQDDQAETLLLRLARGAGVNGLAAMRPQRDDGGFTVARPLLDISRQQIEMLARQWQLNWIEDPSNQDKRFERNWVRQDLLPYWSAKTPHLKRRLAQTAHHLQEATDLLDELAKTDLRGICAQQTSLLLPKLMALSSNRQRNLLRYWLADKEPWRPNDKVLEHLYRDVIQAARDRQPQLALVNGVLTRFQQRLYWVDKALFEQPPTGSIRWLLNEPMSFGPLKFTPCQQAPQLRIATHVQWLDIRFPRGGERMLRHGQHQRLKECWRVAGVPPWMRRWMPLFYYQDTLVGAAGVGVADGWQPDEKEKNANAISWRLATGFSMD